MVLAAELATELGDVTSDGDGGVVSYRRGETLFARVSADALEVRLPPDIAEAAVRTPDTVPITQPSGDGPTLPIGGPDAASGGPDAASGAPDAASGSPPPIRPGWVRFSPGGRERHVVDRALAWFRTAWRHAEGR
jgi:hypothetical protein